eukprot:8657992-Alexandrium_andersonii.AAC.1
MRYYRGAHNPKRIGAELAEKVKKGMSLYDLWMECREDWSNVRVQFTKWESTKSGTYSMDSYMTKDQLMEHYKNEGIVKDIIEEKSTRGAPWKIPHPECPDNPEAMLYLCWTKGGTSRKEEQGKSSQLKGDCELDANDKDTENILAGLVSSSPETKFPNLKGGSSDPAPPPTTKEKPKKEKTPRD